MEEDNDDSFGSWRHHEYTQRSVRAWSESFKKHLAELRRAARGSSDPSVARIAGALDMTEAALQYFGGGKAP